MGSELIVILLVLGVGYYLYSTGKLDEIFGSFGNIGGGEQRVSAGPGGGEQAYAESPGGPETDVSGENAGAIVNGRCKGDPVQCAKAQRLLDQIQQ